MDHPLKKLSQSLSINSGKLLIALVLIVVLFQGLSAWKIMHLDQERRALQSEKAKMAQARTQYETLQKELPALIRKKAVLTEQLPKLEGDLAALQKKRVIWLKEQAQAEATIAQSQTATAIRSELQKAVGNLKQEIQDRTEEIKSLMAPTAILNQSARDLESLVKSQTRLSALFQTDVKQAAEELKSAAATIGKAAINLRANALNFAQSTQSTNTIVDKAVATTQANVEEISDLKVKLNEQGSALFKQLDRFGNGLIRLEKEIASLKKIRQNMHVFSEMINRMDDDNAAALNKLSTLAANSEIVIKQWRANTKKFNDFIQSLNVYRDAINNQSVMMGNQVNAITQTSAQIISEAEQFHTQMKNYSSADTEKAIQAHEKKLAAISERIELDADKIYNLNFSLEKELRKLIIESENLYKMIKRNEKELKSKK